MRVFASVVGALMVLAGSAPAESYTIKIKEHPSLGETISVHDVEKTTTRLKMKKGGKVVNDETTAETKEEAYTATATGREKGAKRPSAYKRTYTKAQVTKGGKTEVASYQGRTVLFNKRGGKYEVTVEGAPALAGKDLKALIKDANSSKDDDDVSVLLPTKAVEVGDTWTIGGKAVAKLGIDQLNADKTKGQGKLLKAYRKDGKQFGVLEFRVRLIMKDQKGTQWAPGELTLTIDTPIDGSSQVGTMRMAMKMAAKAELERDGEKQAFEMIIDGTAIHGVRPVVRPKK